MEREVGLNRKQAVNALSRLTRPTKRPVAPRRMSIVAWRDDEEGQRRYLRPVYGLGDFPDAPRPNEARRYRERNRRHYEKRKARLGRVVNSVFALAGQPGGRRA
jgi:hypothetical protein